MAYHKFVPVPVIDTIFILTALFAAVSAFVGIKRLWSGMKAQAGEIQSGRAASSADIIPSVTAILAHTKFADCNVNRLRQWGHLLLFYQFRRACRGDHLGDRVSLRLGVPRHPGLRPLPFRRIALSDRPIR